MFSSYVISKGYKVSEIPNIKNEGLKTNSKFYDWNIYFQVNDFQVAIDLNNETIKVLDHLKEVRTAKEKKEIKNLINEYAEMHLLTVIK